jgi:hypothetical protein
VEVIFSPKCENKNICFTPNPTEFAVGDISPICRFVLPFKGNAELT